MSECWLYLYENQRKKSIYIGIADSLTRVYGPHHPTTTDLRDASGTVILQTVKPFSSRADARKAEAIAIHLAAFAGLTVSALDEDDSPFTVTNIAGARSTRELGPAIFTRAGEIDVKSLSGTVFVVITADEMDTRPTPFGAHQGAFFAPRAQKYWNIARAKRPTIKRLVAVLKGSRNVVLGSWKVDTEGEWQLIPEPESLDQTYRTRVSVPLEAAENDDYGDVKGKRIVGLRANSGVVYSPDLARARVSTPILE